MQYAPAVARGDASKFVLSWLRANFVSKDGSLLARNEAYELYLAHCQDQLYEPTTSAALGKLIKKVFPDMGTRRLAVNGKKQRFYCGIAYSPAAGHQDTAYCAITWVEETEEAIARDRGGSATARRRKRDRDRDRDDDAGAVVPLRTADAHLELMSVLEYYSRMYKKELWGVNPINPATTDVSLLADGVGSQQSTTLALTSCLLMCSASFLVGHLTIAEDYYHKARVHLGELFDVSDYDIACVLMPFSWWTRLYSGSETEALNKQRYYLMLGKQICERVNALNDQTYFNLTSMSSVIAKQDCSRRLVEVKQQKPFRRSWEPVLGLTHSKTDQHIAGEVQIRIGELYGAMFPICAFYQQKGLDHPERMSHNDLLKHNLGVTNKLDETLAQLIADDQSCTLMYSMMRCQVCAVRTFILWALQSKQRLYAAQNFVQMLLAARTPIRAMTTNELTNNDYLLLRLPVDILVEAGQLQLLRMLLEALQPHTQFYWMRNMCQYIVRRMDEWAPPDVAGGWQDGGEWSSPHPLASQQEESDGEEYPLFPTY